MIMRVLFFFILALTLQSCATKKYIKTELLPESIQSATEETYKVVDNQQQLLQKKEMTFTANGRIKHSKTMDVNGNVLQETKKKLWFIVELYPGKETYYCKTRWKPGQRERISCYTRKQYKENESIYHYNTDGTINKIADNFTTFYTRYFYYTNNELSRIVVKDKNNQLIDEILVRCETKDEKGTCLKQTRISVITKNKEEIRFSPNYDRK